MKRINVPLQISRGIFVYGEIIQMHTIHETNYRVIKHSRNGNRKRKNWYETVDWSYQAQLMRLMHLTIFTQIIHLLIETINQRSKKDILNMFEKASVFRTWWLSILRMPHHTNMLCIRPGPALGRCIRCSCIGPRASGGPAPWWSDRLFIFAR